MNNFQDMKTWSMTKLAKVLTGLRGESCPFPKIKECKDCVANELCQLKPTVYAVKQWLKSEKK